MHAHVRVVAFLVFAGFLSAGGVARLWAALALLVLVYGAAGLPHLAGLGRAFKRLRFLWLSLVLLYFWFTPGDALWPALGSWSPSVAGVREGLVRIGVLALMLAAAQLLLQSTPTERLVAALYWLCTPLQWLGLDRGRFALRLVLVLETVPRLAELPLPATPARAETGRFGRHAAALRARLRAALDAAAAAGPRQVELPQDGPPPRWQWLYPLLVALVLGGAGSGWPLL